MVGAGDVDFAFAIFAGDFFFGVFDDELVELANEEFGDSVFFVFFGHFE